MATKSTPSPPTGRVLDVLGALADDADGATSARLAASCGISTSTCALILAELEHRGCVTRLRDRRYVLGSGLFGIVHALRLRYPLLDIGRQALDELRAATGGACSLTRIGDAELTVLDSSGHVGDQGGAVGHRLPIAPPFGCVAMAWRDNETIDRWLRGSTPRLAEQELRHHRTVLADIRRRGYGVWRFDESHSSLHDRLTAILDSADQLPDAASITRQLASMLTMVSLQSITDAVETRLYEAEFVVMPIFGRGGVPEYQIEIRLDPVTRDTLSLERLETAMAAASTRLESSTAG